MITPGTEIGVHGPPRAGPRRVRTAHPGPALIVDGMSTFRLNLDQGAIDHMLTGRGGLVDDYMRVAVAEVKEAIDQYVPRRDGALAASITDERAEVPGKAVTYKVGTPLRRGFYTELGTGIEGPEHKMIVPVHKKVLRWNQPGAGILFRPRSRGGKPQNWLWKSLQILGDRFLITRNTNPDTDPGGPV